MSEEVNFPEVTHTRLKKPSRAPCRARPRRRGNSTALVVLLPTVVHGTHVVGPIMFGWGVKRLSRF